MTRYPGFYSLLISLLHLQLNRMYDIFSLKSHLADAKLTQKDKTDWTKAKWKSYPGLDIYLPSLDYLLAMKIVAGRPRDIADARALIQSLGFSDPQEVLDILQKYIPARYLTVRTQYIVEDLFA